MAKVVANHRKRGLFLIDINLWLFSEFTHSPYPFSPFSELYLLFWWLYDAGSVPAKRSEALVGFSTV
jgi:hypothetical protein